MINYYFAAPTDSDNENISNTSIPSQTKKKTAS